MLQAVLQLHYATLRRNYTNCTMQRYNYITATLHYVMLLFLQHTIQGLILEQIYAYVNVSIVIRPLFESFNRPCNKWPNDNL